MHTPHARRLAGQCALPPHLHVCVLNRLRLMHALHCMQWKKSTPSPCPRRHTLQKGQW